MAALKGELLRRLQEYTWYETGVNLLKLKVN